MISGSNEQLQQQFEYTLLKPDCHSWWISKTQSDILEEWYAIKFCFKLGKNATETYGMLQIAFGASCMNCRKRPALFKSGHWHFYQDNTPVRNSILVTDYLTKMGMKTVRHPPYSWDLAPCDFWLFPKLRRCCWDERGCDEGHWHAHARGLPWGLPEVVGMVQQVYCSRRRLLWRGQEFHVCTIHKSAHTKKVWKLIVCT